MDRESIWKTIELILLISTAIGLLYPAFVDNKTFAQILVSLLQPELSIGWLSRWLIFILFLFSIYAITVGTIYRKTPVTILASNITVKYLTPDGSQIEVTRAQTLRANQRRVTAFYVTHATNSPNGKIPKDQIFMSATSVAGKLDGGNQIHGSSQKIEVIHLFSRPMPYGWFMPLVPLWFLRSDFYDIPKFVRKYVVKREHRALYVDEFLEEPVMELQATAYPSHNIMLTIDFATASMPAADKIVAYRIKNQGVVSVHADYRPWEKKIIFRVDKLHNEKLRISWELPAPAPTPASA